jgi:hypothetical protein
VNEVPIDVLDIDLILVARSAQDELNEQLDTSKIFAFDSDVQRGLIIEVFREKDRGDIRH